MELNNSQLQERIVELESENGKLKSYFLDRWHIGGNSFVMFNGPNNHPQFCHFCVMVPEIECGSIQEKSVMAAISELAKLLDRMRANDPDLINVFTDSRLSEEKSKKTMVIRHQ